MAAPNPMNTSNFDLNKTTYSSIIDFMFFKAHQISTWPLFFGPCFWKEMQIFKLFRLILFGLLMTVFVSCEQNQVVERENEPDVHSIKESNKEMNKAMQEARDTIKDFLTSFQNPSSTQTYFSIKVRFTEGDETEHIWLSDLDYKDSSFHGKVGNKPLKLSNINLGDLVKVDNKNISDWMIIDNRTLIGGFTIRVLRNGMSKSERENFDQSVPFKIE